METSRFSQRDKSILAEWCEQMDDAEEAVKEVTPPRRQGTRIDSPSASVVQVESSKLLPWMMLACLLSGIAIGVLVLIPSFIDAKVKAGVANVETTSHAADVNARVALDKVEDFRAKLAEKGINVNLDGH